MQEYDLIVIGSGCGMNYVAPILDSNPDLKVAVIDRDRPGGICLTRGCIPSKMLLYPAELVREIERSSQFGIDAEIKHVDFGAVMGRMRSAIDADMKLIRNSLNKNPRIDFFESTAEFIEPYVLKVGDELITSRLIYLSTGSRPMIPPVKGLDDVDFLTSDSVLDLKELPESLVIVGGGYIAAEYGHFFSAMGSRVTIIGRSPRILDQEEPEISVLAAMKLSEHMEVITGHEVVEISSNGSSKKVTARDRQSGEQLERDCDAVLVATGRSSNADVLFAERSGIEVDARGWIKTDEHLETTCKGVWAFGDANGKYLFKHVGNYESGVVYANSILGEDVKADYHAVPHAVFSSPEIAGVGMKEADAVAEFGEEDTLIGFYRFEDTGKGMALGLEDYFVKLILQKKAHRLLGAHIIGPQASVLIHEIIPLMYISGGNLGPLVNCMDIHPSLSEVVKRAARSFMPVSEYHDLIRALGLEG